MSVQIDGSTGNIIATKADYSGNVSIGGTLTYEDVTNIDSVGLITARNGIKVDDLGVQVGTGATVDSAAANTLTFLTNGSEALRINSDLKVLIGSTAIRTIGGASASPHIQLEGTTANTSSAALINNQANTNSPVFSFGKTRGTSDGAVTTVANGDNLGLIRFAGADGTDLQNVTAQIKSIVNGTVAENQIPTDITFETSATDGSSIAERLRITSAGLIGVSNSVSQAYTNEETYTTKLRVGSDTLTSNQSSAIQIGGYDGSGSGVLGAIEFFNHRDNDIAAKIIARRDLSSGSKLSAGQLDFYTDDGDGNLNRHLTIDANGNICIAHTTTLTSGNLQVSTSNSNAIDINAYSSTDANGGRLTFYRSKNASIGSNTIVASGDSLGRIDFRGYNSYGDNYNLGATIEAIAGAVNSQTDMPTELLFKTSDDGSSIPTERMRITDSGSVLIGRTSNTLNSTNFGTRFSGGAASVGFFATSRNVGSTNAVANIYGSAGVLQVKGDGDCENTNNRYTGTSDVKLKENIVDANSQWDDIKSLQVRNYNFKEETGYGTHTQLGLVAQEVETICPGLVGETNDTDDDLNETGTVTKSVAYSVLYMKAVKALQEAMERIETLESEVASLKG